MMMQCKLLGKWYLGRVCFCVRNTFGVYRKTKHGYMDQWQEGSRCFVMVLQSDIRNNEMTFGFIMNELTITMLAAARML